MKLYLLERIGDTHYDETAGMVVAAESAPVARRIADHKENNGWKPDPGDDEDDWKPDTYELWINPARSTIKYLGPFIGKGVKKEEGIILRDFRAG